MGVLPLLLPLGLQVYLNGCLPSIMEPGSRGVTGVWSDCLLRRHDCSWYACSRDVRVPTAPTRPPFPRLHQMEAATSRGPGSWRSHSPTKPPWGWEGCWIVRHSKEDCGGTLPRQTGPVNASTAHDDAVRAPDGAAYLTATPRVALYALPTSGATAKKTHREGSHC